MAQQPDHIIRVCEKHLREIFNRARLWERLKAGELVQTLERDVPTEITDHRGNRCIRSQHWIWEDPKAEVEVARGHQYITETGGIGGSGLPDPKRVTIGLTAYRLVRRHKSAQACQLCATIGPPRSILRSIFEWIRSLFIACHVGAYSNG